MYHSGFDNVQGGPVHLIKSLLFAAVLHVLLTQASHGAPVLYVAASFAHSVVEVDTATSSVVRFLPAAQGTTAVAYNPFNSRVYAANFHAQSVSVMDAASGDWIADVPVVDYPHALVLNATGTQVYVATGLDVRVIDVASNTVVKVIAVSPFPAQLALDSTGRALYLTTNGRTVDVIDTITNERVGEITGSTQAVGIATHPSLPRLYVTDQSRNELLVVDMPGNKIVARIPVGQGPVNVVLNPVATRAYVANSHGGTVSVIDVASNVVIDTIPIGTYPGNPYGLAVHPTAQILYVDQSNDGKILAIDTNSNAITGSVRIGGHPRVSPFAFGPRGSSSPTVYAFEFYNSGLDHFFLTWNVQEMIALDSKEEIRGWNRTGKWFKAYPTARAGTEAVCRFYIPPGLGDSHFFGRSPSECAQTKAKFPALIEEDPTYMYMYLPMAGTCPESTTPVYRAFNNRPDANHRYAADRFARDQVVAWGWIAEGDGPDLVVMCAPV